ncbi:cupredoxin domain-containing protein [Natrarchaeobius oligotrophus]|uniref:Halocyanin domain-containing protein n=1 Tax=Natrarchaeobius chitinivorans TaxID=1679083 RepID=A0A3N6NP62_NATCH|nr:plastocyanin/azurin family copper-binding protein [Natrarchaeobius chitinivorans]RQH01433.1 halocyanin domain-containing protein [Natrarchaeobius chitinivorans]
MSQRRSSRRRVLAGAGAASVAALSTLAGCLGEDDDRNDEAAEDVESDGDGTDGDETTDASGDDETDQGVDDDADEEFVDLTGEDVVEIETREGEDDEPAFVFDPQYVRIDAGTTVRWVNADGVFHTVTSTDSIDDRSGGGETFDETIASEGETFEWTAEDVGTQPYYCSPHAGFMYGELEVV